MRRTTEDLFTQALYYAEEGIKLYRTMKEFSALIPPGGAKTQLLNQLDQVPSFCQSLNYIIKTPTGNKTSAFTKVGWPVAARSIFCLQLTGRGEGVVRGCMWGRRKVSVENA